MRNLTVQRNKSFIGAIVKVNLYIEDPNGTDANFDGTPCRYLGSLKNGESISFPIEDGTQKIFATHVADKKKTFYDYFKIPEGSEDWYISGKFQSSFGNMFVFDNVTDEEILANRAAKSKKSWLTRIVAIAVGLVIGLGTAFLLHYDFSGKTFKTGEFSITLTDEYKVSYPAEYEYDCDYLYESDYALVMITKDPFAFTTGLEYYTLELYAQLLADYNEEENWNTKAVDNFIYYEYEDQSDGEKYSGMLTIYKTSDAFWVFEYITPTENYDDMKSDFLKFAKSVKFTK